VWTFRRFSYRYDTAAVSRPWHEIRAQSHYDKQGC